MGDSSKGILTPQGVTWLGVAGNASLAAGKVAAGLLFGSQTILADGMHSASDLVTDAAVLAGVRAAERPPDAAHHYGHHRATTLVAMFVGLGLLGVAGWIAYQAVATLHHPGNGVVGAWPFWMAVISIPVKEGLYQVTRHVGKRAKNVALQANAWHHRTDAFTSIAAAAGLAGVTFLGPDWAFLDSVTAVLLSGFLVVVAVKIIRQGIDELMDRAPRRRTMETIERIVADTPGVQSYHAVRARCVAGQIEMDLHIQVDPELTVREGHDIATEARRRVLDAGLDVLHVVVHTEPTHLDGVDLDGANPIDD
jgi:cation diffusion facilitator family transporter